MSMTNVLVLDKMKDKDVVVLNVLPREEYEKMHITGSSSLPLGSDPQAFVKKVEQLYGRDKFFITHCVNVGCIAGPTAARVLRENGFKAEDYPGGTEEWFEAGFPVEGTEVPHAAMK
ncbi:MAG TPA: rhodanese-like domain-containing protein [bacterium]|jgi:rhodanese-related sulfurtransferase|nr:rhodanese-like domain-containing protein [bacterium]